MRPIHSAQHTFIMFHMISNQKFQTGCILHEFHFESELTSSASPILVFYSIFNEIVLPVKTFSSIDIMLNEIYLGLLFKVNI